MPDRDPETSARCSSDENDIPRANLRKIFAPKISPKMAAPSHFSIAALALLLGMVGFSAFAFGGVEPWSELALLFASAVVAAFALFNLSRRGMGRHAAIILGLAGSYVCLAVFQVLPLPLEFLKGLSPIRYEIVSDLLENPPALATISYYPVDTIASLRLVFIAISVFAATVAACRSTLLVQWILLGLFLLGVGEAFLAIAQKATQAKGIYWSQTVPGSAWSGSFVNHSNFSQFLNLTIGASLGLLLNRLSEGRRKESRERRTITWQEASRCYGWVLIGIVIQVVAIAASLSRAGLVGMALAAAITCLVLRRTSRLGKSAWALVVVPPVAYASLLLLGFDSVYLRIESLQEQTSYGDRIDLGLCTLRAGWDHPVFGTGLGTHASVFPTYDTTGSIAVAEQADNDYAQVFEETGVIGVILLGGIFATILAAIRRATNLRNNPGKYAAYGALYGLVAIGVQSLTDFGQRVPAVFCTTAILAGVVVGLSPREDATHLPTGRGWRLGILSCAILIGSGWLYLLQSGIADYRAHRWRALADALASSLEANVVEAAPQQYIDCIAALEMATTIQPRRIEHAFWLNAYRWEAFQFATRGANPAETPAGHQTALRIADELAEARRICPTHGPSYTLEGQLRLGVGDPAGGRLLMEGVRLTPNDPVACFAAAFHTLSLPVDEEADYKAFDLLQRAVALDSSFCSDAIRAVIELRGNVEVTARLAGEDPSRLRYLADLIQGVDSLASQAEGVRGKALAVQEELVQRPTATSGEIIDLAIRLVGVGRLEESVNLFRRGLSLRFANNRCRLRLIDVLIKLGRYEEALRETRIANRVQPNSKPVIERLNKLLDLIGSERADSWKQNAIE